MDPRIRSLIGLRLILSIQIQVLAIELEPLTPNSNDLAVSVAGVMHKIFADLRCRNLEGRSDQPLSAELWRGLTFDQCQILDLGTWIFRLGWSF
jgi:hypothetical protein